MQEAKELIIHSKETVLKKLGRDNLKALILVGSFSRGEEIICQDNGRTNILSDIEFLAVTSPGKLDQLRRLGDIKNKDYKISLGFTTERHLKRLKPYIFTVEVKKFGKVIWGDEKILDNIPDYSYENIEPLDGFILLNNRIVEQLILLNRIEDDQVVDRYDFDKNYVQLVNSLLVLNRKYRILYPEKLVEFCKAYENCDRGLLNKIEEAFVSIKQHSGIVIGQEEALKKWQDARGYFKMVWLQETDVFGKAIFLPNFKDRIKGWIKALVIRKQLRYNIMDLFFSSPQFAIYNRAAALYFSDKYQDRQQRETVIREWEDFVK